MVDCAESPIVNAVGRQWPSSRVGECVQRLTCAAYVCTFPVMLSTLEGNYWVGQKVHLGFPEDPKQTFWPPQCFKQIENLSELVVSFCLSICSPTIRSRAWNMAGGKCRFGLSRRKDYEKTCMEVGAKHTNWTGGIVHK